MSPGGDGENAVYGPRERFNFHPGNYVMKREGVKHFWERGFTFGSSETKHR